MAGCKKIKFLLVFVCLAIFLVPVAARTADEINLASINPNSLKLRENLEVSPVKTDFFVDYVRKYVPGEVVVKFKKSDADLGKFEGLFRVSDFSTRNGLTVKNDNPGSNTAVLNFKTNEEAEAVAGRLERDSLVEYAEPNYVYYLTSIATDDPYKDWLWGLDNQGQEVDGIAGLIDADVDAPEAWTAIASQSLDEVIVAVIDTGVLYTHPDLVGSMWDGTNCKDENGNPVVGGCRHGYDFISDDNDPLPADHFHGTHIAGTIAAVKNNGQGILGMAPNAKIMALRAGFGYALPADAIERAIDFATQNGAKVINASFGGDQFSQSLYEAIQRFKQSGGIFVAAAGNEGDNNNAKHTYPSDYDLGNIISVAATDQNDELADFSNYGALSVDIGAPGVNIYSTANVTMTLIEDFESVSQPTIPSYWDVDTDGYWGTYHFSSGNVLYGDYANYPYVANTWSYIISPQFDLSPAPGAALQFKTQCETEYSIESDRMILYFYDGQDFYPQAFWNEVVLDDDSNPNNAPIPRSLKFDIPPQFRNSDFKFAFIWATNNIDNHHDGCWIDDIYIMQPGESDNNYFLAQGTSMAAPHVSGLAAMLWGVDDTPSYSDIKNTILTTGDDLSSLFGKTVTGKRINAYNAVASLLPEPTPTPTPEPTPEPTPSPTPSPTPTPSPSPEPTPTPEPSPSPTPTPEPTPTPNPTDFIFFDNADDLVNGSVSPVLETTGYKNLTIHRVQPSNCSATDTSVSVQISTDAVHWKSVRNLCDDPQITTYDVIAPFYRLLISGMNFSTGDNPKPPVTVTGELTNPVIPGRVIKFFDETTGLINGSVSPAFDSSGFEDMTTVYYGDGCTPWPQSNTNFQLQSSLDSENWANVKSLCYDSDPGTRSKNPQTFSVSGLLYRIRISFMNVLNNEPKPPLTVHAYMASSATPTPSPTPTPEPSPTPEPTPSPSPTPNPTPEPSPEPTPTPEPSPTPTPSPSPEPTPTPGPSPSPTPEPLPSPTPEPSPSPTPGPSPTPSPTPEPTPEPSPSPEPSPTPEPSPEPTSTPEPTPQPESGGSGGGYCVRCYEEAFRNQSSQTPAPSPTPTLTPTPTVMPSPTPEPTRTPIATPIAQATKPLTTGSNISENVVDESEDENTYLGANVSTTGNFFVRFFKNVFKTLFGLFGR